MNKDPVGATTFQDGGSNATTWSLLIAGHFHLPHGTRFSIEADNTTCMTPGWTERSANQTLGCRTENGRLDHYQVTLVDNDGDGRASRDDRLEIRSGPAQENTTLLGPHRLVLALHPEMPLFVLEQDFGPRGPIGQLGVGVFG